MDWDCFCFSCRKYKKRYMGCVGYLRNISIKNQKTKSSAIIDHSNGEFDCLPDEILIQIFQRVISPINITNFYTMIGLEMVSTRFRRCVVDNEKIWENTTELVIGCHPNLRRSQYFCHLGHFTMIPFLRRVPKITKVMVNLVTNWSCPEMLNEKIVPLVERFAKKFKLDHLIVHQMFAIEYHVAFIDSDYDDDYSYNIPFAEELVEKLINNSKESLETYEFGIDDDTDIEYSDVTCPRVRNALVACPNLKSLKILLTHWEDFDFFVKSNELFGQFAPLKSLESLEISAYSENFVIDFLTSFKSFSLPPRLRTLRFEFGIDDDTDIEYSDVTCPRVRNALVACPNLKSLKILLTHWEDFDFFVKSNELFGQFAPLKSLESLEISAYSENFVIDFLTSFKSFSLPPRLRTLRFTNPLVYSTHYQHSTLRVVKEFLSNPHAHSIGEFVLDYCAHSDDLEQLPNLLDDASHLTHLKITFHPYFDIDKTSKITELLENAQLNNDKMKISITFLHSNADKEGKLSIVHKLLDAFNVPQISERENMWVLDKGKLWVNLRLKKVDDLSLICHPDAPVTHFNVAQHTNRIFGSSLMEICNQEKSAIPKFIMVCTEMIEHRGLDADGLYRKSGNLSQIQKIRCQVDQDKYTLLFGEGDVHVLTGTLKLFFRQLEEPLFPLSMIKDFLNAIKVQNARQRMKLFRDLLYRMPRAHHTSLEHLINHLVKVSQHSSKNCMQIHNLAIIFGPTLFDTDGSRKTSAPTKNNKNKGGICHIRSASMAVSNNNAETVQQSNSHLAFNMIMQGQIMEYLLKEHERLFPVAAGKFNVNEG